MPYTVKLISRIERENRIRNAHNAATSAEERDFYDFRNEKKRLKVIRLEIGLPVYRIENCRTYTAQEEYVSKNSKPSEYFQNGQENESVQQIQHNILTNLANTGTDSIVPIVDVLKKEGQREEILITAAGVVVNGNRRLSGMRDLFAMSPGDYPAFSHVNCMVLPEDATAEEVLDVEASLQAKQETKLDYDWIGDCRLISKLLEKNGNTELVAKKLHRSNSEIKNSLRAYTEAQLYLKEWAKKPKEYSLVKDDGEQFFNDLPRGLSGKSGKLEEASRIIAWVLYDNRRKLPGRLYNYNVAVGRRAEDVLNHVAVELAIPVDEAAKPANASEYAIDFEGAATEPSYNNLVSTLKDVTRREEISETVVEVCQGVVESENDRNVGQNAQKLVLAASTRLTEIDLSTAAPSTYVFIARHLETILDKAKTLKEQLAKYQAHQTAKASPTDDVT